MTTLQDLGRLGYQRLGIPVSGALDPVACAPPTCWSAIRPRPRALEIAYQGPTLAVEADSVRIACAGASAPIDVVAGEEPARVRRLAMLNSTRLKRGDQLRIGSLSGGAMLYLAVEGGFDVAPVLGSRSTLVRAGIGG